MDGGPFWLRPARFLPGYAPRSSQGLTGLSVKYAGLTSQPVLVVEFLEPFIRHKFAMQTSDFLCAGRGAGAFLVCNSVSLHYLSQETSSYSRLRGNLAPGGMRVTVVS